MNDHDLNRTPVPAALEAEAGIVASMISEPECIDCAAGLLVASDFYRVQWGKLFTVLVEMRRDRMPVDLPLLADELRRRGILDEVGGPDELVNLVMGYADWSNLEHYAARVREKSALRQICRTCQEVGSAALQHDANPHEVVALLTQQLKDLDARIVGAGEPVTSEVLMDALPFPAGNAQRPYIPVSPGLASQMSGGLELGTMTVVGARPSCGKTSLGLGLCLYATREGGVPVLFISAEMTGPQVGQRLIAMRTNAPMKLVRTGLDPGGNEIADIWERHRTEAVTSASQSSPLFVLPGITDARVVCGHIRRAVAKHGVGLVVVDYLQRLTLSGSFAREDLRMGEMSRLFKDVGLDTNIAVVVLSQLNRASEKDGREPRMSDLRECGRLEEDADNIILIHANKDKEAYRLPDVDTELILTKQRQGSVGRITMKYHWPTMTYHDGSSNTPF